MTGTTHSVKVGEFFVCSWGYDQTNVDYYRVVGVTPKSVKIQHWTTVHTDDSHVVPDMDGGPLMVSDWSGERPCKILTKRVQDHGYGNGAVLTMSSYSDAYPWNGAPRYETALGWGH